PRIRGGTSRQGWDDELTCDGYHGGRSRPWRDDQDLRPELRQGRAEVRPAGAGGFLGRVVRPLQDHRPGAGRDGGHARRPAYGGENEYRRESADAEEIRRAWHSDSDAVQGWTGGGDQDRRPAQEQASGVGRIGSLKPERGASL